MRTPLTFSDFTDRLYVALLNDEEATGSAGSDLRRICETAGLPFNEEWIVRFMNEERAFGNGAGAGMGLIYTFTLSANGLYRAKETREKLRPKSILEKAVALGPDWWAVSISVLSLVFSIIALIRGEIT